MTDIFKKSLVFFGWWFIISISKTQPSIIILLYNRYSGNDQTFHANPVQIPGTGIDRIDIHSLLQEEIVF